MTKPGYKTTEFWLTLGAQLVGALLASGAIHDDTGFGKALGVAAIALASMGYSASRALTKAADPAPEKESA